VRAEDRLDHERVQDARFQIVVAQGGQISFHPVLIEISQDPLTIEEILNFFVTTYCLQLF